MRMPINELGYAMSFVKQAQINSQQSPCAPTATNAGTANGTAPWQLPRGCALSLKPRVAGVLRVSCGRAWVTLDLSFSSPAAQAGDHFVEPGHDLVLRAGQRLVLESWPAAGADHIHLVWEPAAPSAWATRWQTAMEGSVRPAGPARSFSGRLLVRLRAGLVRCATFLLAGRNPAPHGVACNRP